ncbi:hypothetical protein O181_023069 [Austropuccinia psidii MF-1]|uniref:Retrovirus-related Pol polyprotein from transposon TNT 1-94-like beta-barrel domain-containing protein n=1 Tax=Austropuccinia psidii MF-1 TaxID=1389203 RepID=A0A9Q3GYB1_9BASI|nr:hypothetical protein [Austropuccinia psidii MF-1]
MDWKRFFFNGNLQSHIDTCSKLFIELVSVSIKFPNELLSYSLLGKLAGDPKLHQFIEGLTLNKELIARTNFLLSKLPDFFHITNSKSSSSSSDSVTDLVSTSDKTYNIIYYCTNGKHNIKRTSNKKEQFWAENPNLRPNKGDNKHKKKEEIAYFSKELETTLKSTLTNQIVLDCGAINHMFNTMIFFKSMSKPISIPVLDGDSNSSLIAVGTGTVSLLCNSQVLTLDSCLYVPKIS